MEDTTKLENLNHKDLENIMQGLGAVYLKKHYIRFSAKHPMIKTRNKKFIEFISTDSFSEKLCQKIKEKVLSKYKKKFTEKDINDQFETFHNDQKQIFIERVRIELDRQSQK